MRRRSHTKCARNQPARWALIHHRPRAGCPRPARLLGRNSMRSHLRFASVIGAATLSVVAVAPAMAAAPVSQSGANAANLSIAGNANGSGNVTATNDGSSEKKTGDAAPPISLLKGQSLFNGGVLAQEATA